MGTAAPRKMNSNPYGLHRFSGGGKLNRDREQMRRGKQWAGVANFDARQSPGIAALQEFVDQLEGALTVRISGAEPELKSCSGTSPVLPATAA